MKTSSGGDRAPCRLACLLGVALAGAGLAGHNPAGDTSPFHKPIRLTAADGVIDSGAYWAHSGPCVFDVDGDGKLDLLVGDFCTYVSPRKDLSAAERRALRKGMAALEEEVEQRRDRILKAFKALVKRYSREELAKKEVQDRLMKKRQEMLAEPAFKKVADVYAAKQKELNRFLEKPQRKTFGANDRATAHGYVWLFLRK